MYKVTVGAYEFLKKFPDEDAARRHLEDRRWNGRPVCPQCGNAAKMHKQSRNGVEGYYRCPGCLAVFTVRTGTIFERSHVPLHKWLYAVYLVVVARKGISSLQISKEIGVTQKTAWFMLQRLREACGNDDDRGPGGGFLAGIVEADETYIGGQEINKHEPKKLKARRGAVGKTAAISFRKRGGKFRGAILENPTAENIRKAAPAVVRAGSILCIDEYASYQGMTESGHKPVNHSAKIYVDGMAHTNGIESVWAVLRRGFYGVYHSFSVKHLQRYVEEFSFRLNEGNCKVHTLARMDALLRKTVGKRITYAELIAA